MHLITVLLILITGVFDDTGSENMKERSVQDISRRCGECFVQLCKKWEIKLYEDCSYSIEEDTFNPSVDFSLLCCKLHSPALSVKSIALLCEGMNSIKENCTENIEIDANCSCKLPCCGVSMSLSNDSTRSRNTRVANEQSSEKINTDNGFQTRTKGSFIDSNASKLFDALLHNSVFDDGFNNRGLEPNCSPLSLPTPAALSENDDFLPEWEQSVVLTSDNASYAEETSSIESLFLDDKLSVIRIQTKALHLVTPSMEPSQDAVRVDVLLKSKPEVTQNRSDLYELFRARYPVEQWKALGFFTEEYLHLINRHWLQFPPPHRRSHYILAGLYTLVMTVGVTGNFLVIFMFLRCRSLRTPANVLVMNLAVSDFFLLAKMWVFIFNCFYFGPALGAFGCVVYGFLGGLTGTVSIMTLAAIALDRYYVIVYPLERRTTRQRARFCVILVWCYGSVFASLPLTGMGLSRYTPEGYLTSCSFDYLDQTTSSRVFILVFFFAAWVVPFCIITFCYTKIYQVVISGSSGASSRRGQEQEKRKTEIRLAGVVIGVVGLWFIAWTPYAVVALLGISGNAQLISPLSSMIPALFCKTASCVDPFIYAVTHPRFRREFHKFFFSSAAKRRKLESAHGKTQCWKTETSQIPGIMIGMKNPRTDDSCSEEDIEEMVVMVDNRIQTSTCFTSSTVAPEEHNLCQLTFPMDSRANQRLQHPSWFASPYFKRDRSTSLKLNSKNESISKKDPISV